MQAHHYTGTIYASFVSGKVRMVWEAGPPSGSWAPPPITPPGAGVSPASRGMPKTWLGLGSGYVGATGLGLG